MNRNFRRLLPITACAVGLFIGAQSAQAFQAAEGAKKPVEKAAETPAKATKRVKFVKAEKPIKFKQRLEVYNRAKQDKDRLYCREDRMTGSHRKQMRCVTEATRQLEEDAAREFFRYARR